MAHWMLLYTVTAIVFLSLDALGIRFLIRPIFEQHVGHLLAERVRFLPAVAFYLIYIAGVLWFVSMPALLTAAPLKALIGGMILGFLCYSTYEVTNFSTLADWSFQQVAVDVIWGAALTGFSAWIGVIVLSSRLG